MHSVLFSLITFVVMATFCHSESPSCNSVSDTSSCLTLYKEGKHSNGVYQLSPDSSTVFSAYCDMENGGWTLIQRRVDASVNFSRSWDEYENGFGDLCGNFWLGLKYFHLLTSTPVDVLLVLVRKDNQTALMQYSDFFIDGLQNKYTMHVNVTGTYNSVAQGVYSLLNGFGYHNDRPFATLDRPDEFDCVYRSTGAKGGWWYNNCGTYNLNREQLIWDRTEIKLRRAL